MIPFRHADERVWRALHALRSEHRDESGHVVHMDPYVHSAARRDFMPWVFDGDVDRFFGLPVDVDPKLPRGAIRLRHEVEA